MSPKKGVEPKLKADDVEEPLPEEVVDLEEERTVALAGWTPRTELGRRVQNGEITTFDQLLATGKPILEAEIVDVLVPNLEVELINIGQAKGKFGGGKRRAFKQTQKKTQEGNRVQFAALCVVGNKDGIIGFGYGKAREVVPAREKALRYAKMNVFKIQRGSGSWESSVPGQNSIPFKVVGKSGSVIVEIMPAPKGTGLVAEPELAKILRLAGIQDAWTKIRGHSKSKVNVALAAEKALRKLSQVKVKPEVAERLGMKTGEQE